MEDQAAHNIEVAKRVWAQTDTRMRDRQESDSHAMADLVTDDVVFRLACPADTPVFGKEFRGKQAVLHYFGVENRMHHEDAWLEGNLDFIGNADRVVVLGVESYILKNSDVTITNKEFAVVNDFRDGLIAKILLITDMSEFIPAYRAANPDSTTQFS